MTAAELLASLSARGTQLCTDGRVVWAKLKGSLTPTDAKAIEAVEPEIIELLKGRTNAALHKSEQDS